MLPSTCRCKVSRRSCRASGPTSVLSSQGSPILAALISLTNESSNSRRALSTTRNRLAARPFGHDEPPCGQCAPARIDQPGFWNHFRGKVEVGIFENQVWVAAAELQHCLLEQPPGLAGDGAARGTAAGQGCGSYRGVLDDRIHLPAADHERAEQMLGKSRFPKQSFDGQGATRYVRCVFQDRGIARHQIRGREAEDLPEREIPRHHGQYDANGIERYEAIAHLRGNRLALQEPCGVLRVEVASDRAFLRLCDTLWDRLAHFSCHQESVVARVVAQQLPCPAHEFSAMIKADVPPRQECGMAFANDAPHLPGFHFFISREYIAIGWIDGLEGHDFSS